VTWTRRFAFALGLCGLLFMTSTGWLGLLPGAAANLLVDSSLVALIGLYAMRLGGLALGLGLFATIVALDANRATLALGLTPLPDDVASNYWLLSTLPAASVWLVFPVMAGALARFLPPLLGGIAIGAALLPLPALRLVDRLDVLADVYVMPRAGNFTILPVPWLQLVFGATACATLALIAIERPHPRVAQQFVVPALVAVILVVPMLQTIASETDLRASVQIQPRAGGPLTSVSVRARGSVDGAAQLLWDDKPIAGVSQQPLRISRSRGIAQAQFLPAFQVPEVGVHQLELRIGDDQRRMTFEVLPASQLTISIDGGHVTVTGGPADADLDILTRGPEGVELLHRRFDHSGAWRSPLALVQGTPVSIIAQSGDAWTALRQP
jgi:hypothetical protein